MPSEGGTLQEGKLELPNGVADGEYAAAKKNSQEEEMRLGVNGPPVTTIFGTMGTR